jgi:hypothetical protein
MSGFHYRDPDFDPEHDFDPEIFFLVVGIVILCILLIGTYAAGAQIEPIVKTSLHVEETTNQGIVASPLIAPHFDMETISDESPAKGSLLDCNVVNGSKPFVDHTERYLIFFCSEPGAKPGDPRKEYRLRLTGLAFERQQ